MRLASTKDGSRLVTLVAPGPFNNLGGGRRTDHDPRCRDTGADRPSWIEPDAFVDAYIGFSSQRRASPSRKTVGFG